MTYWLNVVSREHVRRGVELGIAQANHGNPRGLQRMKPGDGIVYYSPKERIREGASVKSFTAIGTVDDREPWQADEGSFKPWRRAVSYYHDAHDVPIDDLRDRLDLTSAPNWGIVLRRGLVELSEHDFELISAAMLNHG
jgi:hypothetical protein